MPQLTRPCLVGLLLLLAAGPVRAQEVPALAADDLFRGDEVVAVQLFMHSADWRNLKEHYQENTSYPADLHWRGLVVRNVGIRSRGNGSRNPIKPGLRVDINEYSAGQEFLGLKSIVLENLTQDPAMLRERVTMALFEKMGLPAPRVAHVVLMVNNESIGLYNVVEAVDKKFLTRVYGENDGYLYEFNNKPQWWFDDLGSDPVPYAGLFEAKTHETQSIDQLYGMPAAMVHTFSDARDFVGETGRFLDLPRFMTYLAAEMFMAERDGVLGYDGANNFYVYRFENSDRFEFIPWDKDWAIADTRYSVWTNAPNNPLVRRSFENRDLKAAYLSALKRAAEIASAPPEPPPVSEGTSRARADDVPQAGWLEREMVRIIDMIRPFALADTAKPFENERWEDDISKMLDFARHRSAFVLGEVDQR